MGKRIFRIFSVSAISLLLGFVAIYIYGNSVIATGKAESAWIAEEMWGAGYFRASSEVLRDYELINLRSLEEGSSENSEIIGYTLDNHCLEGSERCYLINMAMANLLIDGREYDSALKAAFVAAESVKDKGVCLIAFEATILKYKISKIRSKNLLSARRSATDIVEKIKRNGGQVRNLRTKECDLLSQRAPQFFSSYVMQVAELMSYASGDYPKAAAYIDSVAERRSIKAVP